MITAILGGTLATLAASIVALIYKNQRDTARSETASQAARATLAEKRATLAEARLVEQATRMMSLSDTYKTQIKRFEDLLEKCTDPEVLRERLKGMFR